MTQKTLLKVTEEWENLMGEVAKLGSKSRIVGQSQLTEITKKFIEESREALNEIYDKICDAAADADETTDDAGHNPDEKQATDDAGPESYADGNKCICSAEPESDEKQPEDEVETDADEDEDEKNSKVSGTAAAIEEIEIKFKNCTFNFNNFPF